VVQYERFCLRAGFRACPKRSRMDAVRGDETDVVFSRSGTSSQIDQLSQKPRKILILSNLQQPSGWHVPEHVYEEIPAQTSLYTPVHTTSGLPELNLLIYRQLPQKT
jgi:hypothetical protein